MLDTLYSLNNKQLELFSPYDYVCDIILAIYVCYKCD